MSPEQFQVLEVFITLIPILTIAWKGSAMLTRLEQMVENLNKCIEKLNEDRENDKAELKAIQNNHEARLKSLENKVLLIESYENLELEKHFKD